MNNYVIRLTMHAPRVAGRHQLRLDEVFDLLDAQDLAEDISDVDAAGRFSLWLRVIAPTPQEALGEALEAVDQADSMVTGSGLGSIIGVDIQLEEPSDTSAPAAAAG